MDIELTGTYPIIIDGLKTGEVSVRREGLFWCFDAKSEIQQDIIRLSVFGDGGEGYLGVMSPENDALALHKKLSRTALAAFPKSIDHCGKKGEPQYPPESPADTVSVSEDNVPVSESDTISQESETSSPQDENNAEVSEDDAPQESDIPPPIEEHPPPAHMVAPSKWRSCVLPCSLFSDIEAKSAIGEIRGALVSNDGDCTLLAVPLSEVDGIGRKSIFCFDRSEEIEGSRYVICKIKNGKICEAS